MTPTKARLSFFVTIDGETKTVYVNKSRGGIYTLDVSAAKKAEVVEVKFYFRKHKCQRKL